jgi:hypothetical protein
MPPQSFGAPGKNEWAAISLLALLAVASSMAEHATYRGTLDR